MGAGAHRQRRQQLRQISRSSTSRCLRCRAVAKGQQFCEPSRVLMIWRACVASRASKQFNHSLLPVALEIVRPTQLGAQFTEHVEGRADFSDLSENLLAQGSEHRSTASLARRSQFVNPFIARSRRVCMIDVMYYKPNAWQMSARCDRRPKRLLEDNYPSASSTVRAISKPATR